MNSATAYRCSPCWLRNKAVRCRRLTYRAPRAVIPANAGIHFHGPIQQNSFIVATKLILAQLGESIQAGQMAITLLNKMREETDRG